MDIKELKKGAFIMHKEALDCCVEIMEVLDTAPTDPPRIVGRWWNLGYTGRPWLCQNASKVYRLQIGPKEATNWLLLTLDDLETPRIQEGPPRRWHGEEGGT